MADTLELLRRVPTFEGLPEDQITWFISQSEELHLKPGDFYTRQGDPADRMAVILEGQWKYAGS
jgi:CRP-like cAMP-binding protein